METWEVKFKKRVEKYMAIPPPVDWKWTQIRCLQKKIFRLIEMFVPFDAWGDVSEFSIILEA